MPSSRRVPRVLGLVVVLLATIAVAADVPVAGTSLRMVDSPRRAARRKITFVAKDPAIALSSIDAAGVTIEVANVNPGHEQAAAFTLPAAAWSQTSGAAKAFRYRDAHRTHGPVTAMAIRPGKRMTFVARGALDTFTLGAAPQGGVVVAIDAGATRYCAVFGGTVKTDTRTAFVAVHAPAPDACPAIPIPPGTTTTTLPGGASVLQHHRTSDRAGVYVDPAITVQAAAAMHLDPGFHGATNGKAYAQPLFVDGGGAGDRLFVATEQNRVYALDATTGAEVWNRQLAPSVPLSDLKCGNIDPLGVTGTPVIDAASRTLFLDAMTTPDGGTTKRHLIYGLALEDGSDRAPPVDVTAALAALGMTFDAALQNERGALVIFGDRVYVPYGGHFGDCGDYRGWVVGVSLGTPRTVGAWETAAQGGGAWAPGGLAADASGVYVATGNTFGVTTWSGGEAIIRLHAGPKFSGRPADYFAPHDWRMLDAGDVDIGGSGPIALDLPGATPSQLLVSLGKNGWAYLVDRSRAGMGGITPHDGVASRQVADDEIINAAVAYHTPTATYVAFKGHGTSCPGTESLTAVKIAAGSPPTITPAWCATNGTSSPMVTTTDGQHDAIVWTLGSESDNRLHGVDGDTGQVVFAGGGPTDAMTAGLSRYITAIAAKGKIYVAGTDTVYSFTSR